MKQFVRKILFAFLIIIGLETFVFNYRCWESLLNQEKVVENLSPAETGLFFIMLL